MPWTFAHPAAVLPLRRCGLPFAPLVVGSMSPDFSYFLGSFESGGFTHSLPGLLLFCLPMGLLVLFVASWLREPVAQLLPQPHRQALLATADAPARGWQAWCLTAAALLLGASTHLVWDAFTHEGQFFVQHIGVLRLPLFPLLGREFRVFNVLQHLSTLAGIAILGLAYWRYAKRFGSLTIATGADRHRCLVLLALASAALLAALPLAVMEATAGEAGINVFKLVVYQVVYATTAFLVLLCAAALLRRRGR